MKQTLISLILMMSIGCGQDTSFTYISEELTGYAEAVRAHYPEEPLRYTKVMYFADLSSRGDGNVLAVCYNKKEIIVDAKRWSEASEKRKLAVMAHELGHCDFGLGHINGESNLMSPYIHQSVESIKRLGLTESIKEILK